MRASPQALALVTALLEEWVRLAPPRRWPAFTGELIPGEDLPHGMSEYIHQVAPEDLKDFIDGMARLVTGRVMVPRPQKWALKMPGGYCIYGQGWVGWSVCGKNEAIFPNSQIVENPTMTPEENQRWESARRGL